jgi:hypothetical protein
VTLTQHAAVLEGITELLQKLGSAETKVVGCPGDFDSSTQAPIAALMPPIPNENAKHMTGTAH